MFAAARVCRCKKYMFAAARVCCLTKFMFAAARSSLSLHEVHVCSFTNRKAGNYHCAFHKSVFSAWNAHIMYSEKKCAAATTEYWSEPSGSHSCEMLDRGRCLSRDPHSTEGWFASDSSVCGACPTL